LVGCYAAKDQIQIWDIRKQKQLEALTWSCGKDEVSNVFTCCYSPLDTNFIIAGACGVN